MGQDEAEFIFDPAFEGEGMPVTEVIGLTRRKWTRTIIETVAAMFREERILMEGACAPPFAILDDLREEIEGKTVAIPVTGRNLPAAKVERVVTGR